MYNERMMDETDKLYKLFREFMDNQLNDKTPKEDKKESRLEIITRIAKNSSNISDRDYALDNRTWVVSLQRPVGSAEVACLAIVPVDKIWLRTLQFKNMDSALESITYNENDWYRFLA